VQAPPWLLIGMEGFFGARLLHERRLPDRTRCRTPGSLSLCRHAALHARRLPDCAGSFAAA